MTIDSQHIIEQSQASEWRRGGDPANPPIDRPGVWERRTVDSPNDTQPRAIVSSLGETTAFKWSTGIESTWWLGSWQKMDRYEWRYIGPLPSETGDPAPGGGGKGDRKALARAYAAWQVSEDYCKPERVQRIPDRVHGFLESPAGRAAVLKLWGEGKAFENMNKECDRLSAELQIANAMASERERDVTTYRRERDSLASQLAEARAEIERKDATIHRLKGDLESLRSRLSASPSEAGGNPRPPEKEPPIDHNEAIRRLWAMANGQRDQIEDLQERVKELEAVNA